MGVFWILIKGTFQILIMVAFWSLIMGAFRILTLGAFLIPIFCFGVVMIFTDSCFYVLNYCRLLPLQHMLLLLQIRANGQWLERLLQKKKTQRPLTVQVRGKERQAAFVGDMQSSEKST